MNEYILAFDTQQSLLLTYIYIVQAGPDDNLKDVALKILQNGVATVPIIHSPAEDGSYPQLLYLASLAEVLKCEASTWFLF